MNQHQQPCFFFDPPFHRSRHPANISPHRNDDFLPPQWEDRTCVPGQNWHFLWHNQAHLTTSNMGFFNFKKIISKVSSKRKNNMNKRHQQKFWENSMDSCCFFEKKNSSFAIERNDPMAVIVTTRWPGIPVPKPTHLPGWDTSLPPFR